MQEIVEKVVVVIVINAQEVDMIEVKTYRPRGGQEYRRRDDRRARSPHRGEQRYERRYDNRREYRNHSNERREERVTNRTEQPAADDERQ
ncbi:hypothetical protein G6F55_012235 [Rhizopus delemar]|uniref:Uncharacterized protein n=1 Tax=Rhizopus delemar TaxID=936053 RepID=A0A9P6YW54_9FUNG|nr:hypothetical protein G6F55_012235 [Rhizopus delemar]KAG1488058.1 hypothetical protein G6F54_012288 [Rhizopus delemar]KAG1495471.1 hypothetical protein G6F53_012368 [Rhizopus delemar]KAG1546117.1 hypothetical protein G6F49_010593 [Rhizopus delemar]KAG1565754.1 hypothetical protein G6F50_009779 [Rhizopus delemar]